MILIGFLIILPIWAQRRRNWDDINREETAPTVKLLPYSIFNRKREPFKNIEKKKTIAKFPF